MMEKRINLSPDAGGGGSLPAPDVAALDATLHAFQERAKGYPGKLGIGGSISVLGITQPPFKVEACDRARQTLLGIAEHALDTGRLTLANRNSIEQALERVHSDAVRLTTSRGQLQELITRQRSGAISVLDFEEVLNTGSFDEGKAHKLIQSWRATDLQREGDAVGTAQGVFSATDRAAIMNLDKAMRNISAQDIQMGRKIPEVLSAATALSGLTPQASHLDQIRDVFKLDFKGDSEEQKIMKIAGALRGVLAGLPVDVPAFEAKVPGITQAHKTLTGFMAACKTQLDALAHTAKQQTQARAQDTTVAASTADPLNVYTVDRPSHRQHLSARVRSFFKPYMKALEVGGLVVGAGLVAYFGASYDLGISLLGGANGFSQIIGGANQLLGSVGGVPLLNLIAGTLAATGIMSVAQNAQRYFVRQDVEEVARSIGTAFDKPAFIKEKTTELFLAASSRLAAGVKSSKRDQFLQFCDGLVDITNQMASGQISIDAGQRLFNKRLEQFEPMHAYKLPSPFALFSNSESTDLGRLYLRSMAYFMLDATYNALNWGGQSHEYKQVYHTKMEGQIMQFIKEDHKLSEFIVRYTNPVTYGISDWLRFASLVTPAVVFGKLAWDYVASGSGAGKAPATAP